MAVLPRAVGQARPWTQPRRGIQSQAGARRLRILWLLAVALLLASVIWGRLAYWQVVEHQRLSAVASAYHAAQVTLPANRGLIYDRDGLALAVDTTVYDVTIAPDQVRPQQRKQVADALAGALGVPAQQVMGTLEAGGQFAFVARRQPKDRADQVAGLRLPGVSLEPHQQRTYLPGGTPDVSLGSSLLGFVDYSGRGQRGLERSYNDRLAGQSGSVFTYRDLFQNDIAADSQKRRDKVDGSDLHLTLDSSVQSAAEQAIADGVRAANAERGSVIVLDSKSGAVVAWADYPAYDANQFPTTDPARTSDPIVSDVYEPGSVMKVVTLAGALDQGKITPDTTIQDPGFINVGGETLHDWTLSNSGTVTMTKVLERSLNVGAVRAQQMEGRDAFFHYLDAFGFDAPSGIDVAGESTMKMGDPARLRDAEVATAAYGQGIAVNMVQMAAAINVIANQGRWVEPHVVDRVGTTAVPTPASRQVITPQTAATMTQMMQSVVQRGSGWTARVPGFESNEAGKTGTSQIPENGRYSQDHVWASYAGFLPADNPRFTMLVVVKQPNNGSSDHNEGYYVSGPIWKRIAEQTILDWRITPGASNPSN